MPRPRDPQAGFTLIEMMFVVAIIAILAAIAIPVFTKEANKGKGQSEVMAFFTEIANKQEQFKIDNTGYKDTTGPCPASPTPTGVAITCQDVGQPWAGLRIEVPFQSVACTYDIQAGNAVGTNNPGGFTFTSPVRNWYYVIATSDEDGGGAPNATFFTSSIDSSIQKLNEGY